MRVLHLVGSLTGGGAERQLALLTTELCRLGVATHLGFLCGGVNLDVLRDSDVRLYHLPSSSNYDPLIAWRVLRIIKAVRPHIIQTWLTQMDVLGGFAAMISQVPHVVSERSSSLAYPSNWKNGLRKWIGRRAAAIVANSECGARYWREVQKGLRIDVIRNGLDMRAMQNLSAADTTSFGLLDNTELILFAGRLSPEKNPLTLIAALDHVLSVRPEASAILFGEGPLRSDTESYIAETRVRGRIRLNGYTRELWHWMRRASVFVSISEFEGNPNTVLEAMALGCPLVVSDIPQHREILDNSTAIFCNSSSGQVATSILEVLKNPGPAAERAAAARRRATAWSVDAMARQYVDFYRSLLALHARVA